MRPQPRSVSLCGPGDGGGAGGDSDQLVWLRHTTTVVGLLSELLFQMDNGWVFKRFVTQSLEEVDDLDERHRKKQLKISGIAYGERYRPEHHKARYPVQAVLLPRLKVRRSTRVYVFTVYLMRNHHLNPAGKFHTASFSPTGSFD